MANDSVIYESLPTHCPTCDQELEVGQPRKVFDNQQSAHVFFKNGSYIICNLAQPVPKRCTTCSCAWLNKPGSGKCIQVRGV